MARRGGRPKKEEEKDGPNEHEERGRAGTSVGEWALFLFTLHIRTTRMGSVRAWGAWEADILTLVVF